MSKKHKPSGEDPYLLIPASVIKDPRIQSLSEAAVYSLILGFSRKHELLKGGQNYIAGWTKLSRERVNRILFSLESRGLIQKVPLEQHGCMIRYGYMTAGCTSELTSHATCELPSEITSQKTSELISHKNTIEKSKSNNARARAGKKDRFNDFEQRSYDYDQLERILTQ